MKFIKKGGRIIPIGGAKQKASSAGKKIAQAAKSVRKSVSSVSKTQTFKTATLYAAGGAGFVVGARAARLLTQKKKSKK